DKCGSASKKITTLVATIDEGYNKNCDVNENRSRTQIVSSNSHSTQPLNNKSNSETSYSKTSAIWFDNSEKIYNSSSGERSSSSIELDVSQPHSATTNRLLQQQTEHGCKAITEGHNAACVNRNLSMCGIKPQTEMSQKSDSYAHVVSGAPSANSRNGLNCPTQCNHDNSGYLVAGAVPCGYRNVPNSMDCTLLRQPSGSFHMANQQPNLNSNSIAPNLTANQNVSVFSQGNSQTPHSYQTYPDVPQMPNIKQTCPDLSSNNSNSKSRDNDKDRQINGNSNIMEANRLTDTNRIGQNSHVNDDGETDVDETGDVFIGVFKKRYFKYYVSNIDERSTRSGIISHFKDNGVKIHELNLYRSRNDNCYAQVIVESKYKDAVESDAFAWPRGVHCTYWRSNKRQRDNRSRRK
ncbi:MAG: hypothetical protein AB2693_21190, partial [Candidatus Thiodiazotropha sp.]